MTNVRIVAAIPHNKTEELEIILEVTKNVESFNLLTPDTELISLWLNANELLNIARKEST